MGVYHNHGARSGTTSTSETRGNEPEEWPQGADYCACYDK